MQAKIVTRQPYTMAGRVRQLLISLQAGECEVSAKDDALCAGVGIMGVACIRPISARAGMRSAADIITIKAGSDKANVEDAVRR